jgi:periplasmic protein CpxP/Spy
MENNRFLKFIIASLLIINLMMLGHIWFPPQPKREDIVRILTDELNFTPEQRAKFDLLHDSHRENMHFLKRKNEDIHDQFFKHINDAVLDSAYVKSTIDSMSIALKNMETANFFHFRNVRDLCTPEQKERYAFLIQEAFRKMARKK